MTNVLCPYGHRGYQTWHRELDQEVVDWLKNNQAATPQQFESWLRWRYSQADLLQRFPNGF
jgi:poly(3-hydroxyalkanoate) synthetase